jgi:uncharacterized protein (DUF849 family)
MIQCALNGAYTAADHPAVPVTPEQIVADARACRDAGAASVHFHPHRPGGLDSMAADVLDPVVAAVRAAVPGLEISCSTHADIDLGGAAHRCAAVRGWSSPPDAVSLNLAEPGSAELGAELLAAGVAIEAGLFTLADADALLAAPWAQEVRRVLVEVIHEHDDAAAVALAAAIDERVATLGRPRLWHGDGRANWAVADEGLRRGHDIRVGLEDTLVARDGGPAPPNAEQVAEYARLGPRGPN